MKKVSLLCLCGAVLLGFGVTDNVSAQTTMGTIKVPVGATGKSAYQIWQDAGNTGSEADFLASLVGKDGTPGTNGTNGCATTITKSKVGRTTTLTAKDCNNTTVWTETVSDGTDGAAGQDGAPGCADKLDVSAKNAQGCYTITKTPYSLVNGTCAVGTPDSKQVCDGANGTTPISCETTITMSDKDTSTGCYTITTQKRKANAANTSCVADGSAISKQVCDGATGATGATGPQGPAGTDGKDRCDDVAASDLATTEQNTKRVYVAQSGTTRGYTSVIVTYCDGNTTETRELDSCAETPYDSVLTSCPTNQRHMDCKTPTNTSYSFCETGAGLNSEISKKLSTSELGTALKDNSVKTDLADAVTGSGALSSYASKTEVETVVAGKADASDLTALSGKVDANTENIGKKLDTADFGATANTWAGSQTTLAKQSDLTTLSGTVSGHTTQIANKLDAADFGTKANSWASTQTTLAKQADLSTVEQTANNAATNANSALSTATTASNNATRALTKAATNETNIASLDTTLNGNGTATNPGLVSTVSALTTRTDTLDSTVNGTCSGRATNCTQSLESRIRALETAARAAGWAGF